MTFIGAEQPVADASKTLTSPDAPITDPDLMARVIATATQLDAFSQAGGNAEHIGVRWDADREVFIIALAGQDLVIINETAIFPNTFQDPAVDALQVANRLRYLLGEAPPLATIEELPEPEPAPAPAEVAPRIAMVLTGVASWYGPGFHGRRSASGEVFNQQAMTAAHRHLPFGTLVRVTNLNNGRQVIVRINDRGPFIHGRTIDVSAGAAATLGMTYSGIARVRLEVLED
jgi:rare lipoprotein A